MPSGSVTKSLKRGILLSQNSKFKSQNPRARPRLSCRRQEASRIMVDALSAEKTLSLCVAVRMIACVFAGNNFAP